jgi:hypothetical protein
MVSFGTVDLNKTVGNRKWKKLDTNIITAGSINLILNEGKPYTKRPKSGGGGSIV